MEPEALLIGALAAGLGRCSAVMAESGGLLGALLLAGLLGGVTHCAGMCGPFVLTQVTERLRSVPVRQMRELRRLTGAALLPYHLGRLTTYVGLGTAAALAVGGLVQVSGLRWLSAVLLALAALFFLAFALHRLGAAWRGSRWDSGWAGAVQAIARPLFDRPTGWRGYALGVALGLIPCGMLYGALAAASATADPLAGGMAMAAFGLGTVPALLGVGILGHAAGRRWPSAITVFTPALMTINAGVLGFMAWRLVA